MKFRLFWTLTRKVSFDWKVLGKVVKTSFYVSIGTLQNTISERKFWKFEVFRIIIEVFGTMEENHAQDCQSSNRCRREQFIEKSFSKEKKAVFFPVMCDCLLLAKKFARFAKPAMESFWQGCQNYFLRVQRNT